MTQATSHRPTIAVTRHAISAGHYLAATAGLRHFAGRRQRDRCGLRRRDRARCPAERSRRCRRCRADHDLPRREGGGRDDRRPRPLAKGARSRSSFMREHGGKIPKGVLRTVVPAAPDAWITALRRYGTMSFGEVAEAAIRLARDGFPMYPLMAASLKRHEADHRAWPSTAADLSAEWAATGSRRSLPANRPRRIVAIHGRRGTRRCLSAAARRVSKRPATPSIAATSPARSSPL